MNKLHSILTITAIVMAMSCRKSDPIVPDCFTIDFVSGNNQIGSGDGELDSPLVVKVTNQNGKAASNMDVTFITTKGGGYINKSYQSKDVVKTDGNGEAQITYLMNSGFSTNTATEHRVKASISDTQGTCTGSKSVEFYAEKAAIRIATVDLYSTKLNSCGNQATELTYKYRIETNIQKPSTYVWKLADDYLFQGQYYNSPLESILTADAISDLSSNNYFLSGVCSKFGSSGYVDDTYTLKVYTKDKVGSPNKLLATSNAFKIRTNKPAGSNRIGVAEGSDLIELPTKQNLR